MLVLRDSKGKPVLIHCSAGIGRTGTFVCTDLGMHDLDNNKVVDVPALMRRVREQRLHSVQTDVSCMHTAGQHTARDCRCSTYLCTRRSSTTHVWHSAATARRKRCSTNKPKSFSLRCGDHIVFCFCSHLGFILLC
jgi:hypothetical protein